MTIRSHLMLLVMGAALPVLVFAILLPIALVEQDRVTLERGATDRARAMMTAVDAELRGSVTSLQAIAASPLLQAGDLVAFHDEAARVLATQPTWFDLTLARASGEKVVDARQPADHGPERVVDAASAASVLTTGEVAIGNVERLDHAIASLDPSSVSLRLGG